MMSFRKFTILVALFSILAFTTVASAGPIFLTGHDPDFHSQGEPGAVTLFRTGLNFVDGDITDTNKFLWVESRIARPGGHRIGESGLGTLGLTLGTNYDRANATELAGVDFSNYTAIAIASSFGGLLTRAELDGLIGRSSDIESFINAGGGLFAASECFPCGANLLGGATTPDLFGYLPVTVTSIVAAAPFTATIFGTGLGLVNGDLNSATHNSFGLVGGLNIVDTDRVGNATTLAGNVTVGAGGFNPAPVPEPSTMLLLGFGVVGLVGYNYRRRKQTV